MSYILIADDNDAISEVLSIYVEKNGYTSIIARDGEEALKYFQEYNPIIILLDITMPKKNGFEVCREIRQVSNVPIIIITARDEEFNKIMGLDIGADDYIVKPFSPGEILARIRAILRRNKINKDEHSIDNNKTYNRYGLKMNIEEYSIFINDNKINLNRREIETMWLLIKNINKVFTRDNLLDSLWGFDYFGDNRTVDSHIKRLRKKIDEHEHPNWDIVTVRGVGYKFEINNTKKELF